MKLGLPFDVARCRGVPAGPQGLQWRDGCADCRRRTAFAPVGYVTFVVKPPDEVPCPIRIDPAEAK